MNHTSNDLAEAKRRLRIPQLWVLLNQPGTPAKSCHCPWRADKRCSFSVFADGMRWHDFAACEGGDAVDFLAKVRGLSVGDAIRQFKRLSRL